MVRVFVAQSEEGRSSSSEEALCMEADRRLPSVSLKDNFTRT